MYGSWHVCIFEIAECYYAEWITGQKSSVAKMYVEILTCFIPIKTAVFLSQVMLCKWCRQDRKTQQWQMSNYNKMSTFSKWLSLTGFKC